MKRAKLKKAPQVKAAATTKKRKAVKKSSNGVAINLVGLGMMALGVSVIGGVAFALINMLLEEQRSFQTVVNQSVLTRYQTQIEVFFRAETKRAELLSQEPGLAKLILAGDKAQIADREKELQRRYPIAARIRLLPVGVRQVETLSIPPLSFADLEQLRLIEKGQQPPLEVFSFNSPGQHYNRVWPLYLPGGDKQMAGIFMVQYSLNHLRSQLSLIGDIQGQVRLMQGKGAKPLLLAETGTTPVVRVTPLVADIAGTRWHIQYLPGGLLTERAEQRQVMLYGIPGFGLIFFILGWFVVTRFISGALRTDQGTLLYLVRDIVNRKLQTDYPLKLRDFKDMRDVLLEMGRERVVAAKPKSFRKSGITDVGQAHGMQVEEMGSKQVAADMSDLIFRAYDIRGIVGDTLTPEVVYEIGRAFGSEAYEQGQQSIVIARDGRHSSKELAESLTSGLQATGRDVIDVGMVPTPLLYFATEHLRTGSGIMVTGSHNGPEYNGLKMVMAGKTLADKAIKGLRSRIISGNLLMGQGGYHETDVIEEYLTRLTSGISLARGLKVVVDCGNGVAGVLAERLFKSISCEVVPLYCEVNGDFPNHHPDPTVPANMHALIDEVKNHKADLGIAFDGDGDRLGLVDGEGNIIWPDRMLMLLALDVLRENQGSSVIFDVKCSRNLPDVIRKRGGEPLMWKTGHSLIKAKMKETGAVLAGEMSGHLIVRDRWYGFDDALYAAARIMEIIAADPKKRTPTEIFGQIPNSLNTPELRIEMEEGEPHKFMEQLLATPEFSEGQVSTIDGVRVDFADGFGLVRASNTSPCLVMRFEADSEQAMSRIQDIFRLKLYAIDPNIELPF